jgi:UDP-N-acetyl-D-galactosamine dehydrogenase
LTSEWLDGAKIAVVGLGYVGLPLAVEFGRKFPVLGFDINEARVAALREGRDDTLETEAAEFEAATMLGFTTDAGDLRDCNIFIVTVPTPIDDHKRPDLRPLISASQTIGDALKKGDTVIFESTVYPGCTEEECVPILEKRSGLRFNQDFTVGYSPERINPGDKQHRLPSIRKVTSGSTPEAAERIDALYRTIITAGTFPAQSIKVAEAAKVIENTQRDLNIALINDLAMLFGKLGIDTMSVLEAAGTKWNFLPFRPGLVGGHCISIDPYYLTHKAQQVGHHPDVILAGRRTNDGMGQYVAEQVVKLMARKNISTVGARILMLGLTFKENCPDLRNTRVIDIVRALEDYNVKVDVHDPWASSAEAEYEYGIGLVTTPEPASYDAVIVAVGHDEFHRLGAAGVRAFGKPEGSLVYDVKHVLPQGDVDGRL